MIVEYNRIAADYRQVGEYWLAGEYLQRALCCSALLREMAEVPVDPPLTVLHVKTYVNLAAAQYLQAY